MSGTLESGAEERINTAISVDHEPLGGLAIFHRLGNTEIYPTPQVIQAVTAAVLEFVLLVNLFELCEAESAPAATILCFLFCNVKTPVLLESVF